MTADPLYTIAYSSDSDDALMIAPWKESLICQETGPSFTFLAEDIEILNQCALQKRYAVSAVSAAVYPKISHLYRILPLGASFGESYGPAVITSPKAPYQDLADLKEAKIALPGENTSAYATTRMLLPDFEPYFVPFHKVQSCVQEGACEAGVLIHEPQLQESPEYKVIGNLGSFWQKCHGTWSLPLGLIVIGRHVHYKDQGFIANAYRKSIIYGWKHHQELLPQLTDQTPKGFSAHLLKTYLKQYVGNSATALLDHHRKSLQIWFQEGTRQGLWDHVNLEEAIADDLINHPKKL